MGRCPCHRVRFVCALDTGRTSSLWIPSTIGMHYVYHVLWNSVERSHSHTAASSDDERSLRIRSVKHPVKLPARCRANGMRLSNKVDPTFTRSPRTTVCVRMKPGFTPIGTEIRTPNLEESTSLKLLAAEVRVRTGVWPGGRHRIPYIFPILLLQVG